MVVQKERSESREFKQVRLFREDVDKIEQTLIDIGPDPHKIEFSNGEWEAETIAELATKGTGPFNEFEMKRHNAPGLITFETRRSVTRLYVSSVDDLRLRGAYDKIGSILQAAQRPRWVRGIYSTPVFAMFLAVGVIAVIVAISNAVTWATEGDVAPLWLSALCLAGTTFSVIGTWHLARVLDRNGEVHLVPRADRPNFFTRQRDNLAMLAIGTVVGVVVTLLTSAVTGE